MIVQNTSTDGTTDISFTDAEGRHGAWPRRSSAASAEEIGATGVTHDDDIAKVALVGAGMKTTPGIAAKMFRVLADEERQHRDDLDVDDPDQRRSIAGDGLERAARCAAHRVRARLRRRRYVGAAARAQVTRPSRLVGAVARTRRSSAQTAPRCDAAASSRPVEGGRAASRSRRRAPTRSCARPAGCSTTSPATSSTLAEFVATGDHEVPALPRGVRPAQPDIRRQTLVEIGSGIGRMTCAFTRAVRSGRSPATSTAAFLERCRETVAQFGKRRAAAHARGRRRPHARPAAERRPTSRSATSRCSTATTTTRSRSRREAVRVVRPGGRIALNFRTWVARPTRSCARRQRSYARMWRVPGIGGWLSRRRLGRPGSAGRPTGCTPTRSTGPLGAAADRHRRSATHPQRKLPFGVTDATDADVRRRQPQPLVARRRRVSLTVERTCAARHNSSAVSRTAARRR